MAYNPKLGEMCGTVQTLPQHPQAHWHRKHDER